MQKKVTFKVSLCLFLCILMLLVFGAGVLKLDLHVVLLGSLSLVVCWSMGLGFSWNFIRNSMSSSVQRAFDALLIFILIGATIGVWIQSGTVPSLIFYGLDLLSPTIFLPAGLLICSITSLATGTSWGTIGTVGVALLGIGESLGIPTGLTAGMIVSGAFFGDKMSPLSDTTNLAAASTDTKLYDHIGAMLYTTVPAYVVALILYTVMGLYYGGNEMNNSQVLVIQNALSEQFVIHPAVFIPIVVVLVLSVMKKPAILTMGVGVIVGLMTAIFFQDVPVGTVLSSINNGYTEATGIEIVDKLLVRGGIQSMMWTFSLAFIALLLGGILDEVGYLKVLIEKVLRHVQSTGSLVLTTISTSVIGNMVMCEAYLSIILNGKLYREAYVEKGLETRILSRSIEEGATLTTGLIPWTTAGAFIAATLNVPTSEYLFYTFFNLLNPIIGVLVAYVYLLPSRNNKIHQKI